jgi:hypothetical protein
LDDRPKIFGVHTHKFLCVWTIEKKNKIQFFYFFIRDVSKRDCGWRKILTFWDENENFWQPVSPQILRCNVVKIGENVVKSVKKSKHKTCFAIKKFGMILCPHCQKEYSNKYTLEKHVGRAHRDVDHAVDNEFACPSSRCEYRAQTMWEVNRHITKCFEARMDDEIERLHTHYSHEMEMKDRYYHDQIKDIVTQKEMEIKDIVTQKEMEIKDIISQKDLEIRELSVRLEMLQKEQEDLKRRSDEMVDCQLKRANDMIGRCIDRPTTMNNLNATHHHINNILVDGKTFLEMTDPERIEEIARQKMPPYWWKGQAGVAEFLYDHVICCDDDKKLIACTDASRKKMKYTNEKNEVEDDIGATKFISKVYQPIRTVSNELHDNITEQLEQDAQTNKIDRFSAELKKERAIEAAMDITRIRDSELNHSFTAKLCSLAKV